jgi:hypothetical protein
MLHYAGPPLIKAKTVAGIRDDAPAKGIGINKNLMQGVSLHIFTHLLNNKGMGLIFCGKVLDDGWLVV